MQSENTNRETLKHFRALVRERLTEPMKRGDALDRERLADVLQTLGAATQQESGHQARVTLQELGDLLLSVRLHLQLAGK